MIDRVRLQLQSSSLKATLGQGLRNVSNIVYIQFQLSYIQLMALDEFLLVNALVVQRFHSIGKIRLLQSCLGSIQANF